jgi:integral membrane protein
VTAPAAPPTVATSSGVLTRYRVMAYVTGVVLATSCLVGLSFWPWYVGESAAGVLWTAHGWLYVLYVVAAFHLAYRLRWKPVRTVLVLLAGTVPFMSFVAERRVTADLRRQEQPTGPAPAAPAPPA